MRLPGILFLVFLLMPAISLADPLVQMVQQDLQTLGYDVGTTSGEMNVKTAVAISKFQAENQLEVTGEASPQLAGVLKAHISGNAKPAVAAAPSRPAPAPAPVPARDPASLQAAQNACLQEKMEAAQANQKKKRGFGSLMRAAGRIANRVGGNEVSRTISETSRNVYDVDATARDLNSAAKDLGVTTDDIEACRNPA